MDWVTNVCARLTGSREGQSDVFRHLTPVTNVTGDTVGLRLIISETNTTIQSLGFESGNTIRKVNGMRMIDRERLISLLDFLKDRKTDALVVELDTGSGIQTNAYFLEPDHSVRIDHNIERVLKKHPRKLSIPKPVPLRSSGGGEP